MTQPTEPTFEPIVRLTAQWRRGGAWLGPAWAMLCGVIASAQFQWSGGQILTVLVGLIVVEGLWTTLWSALAETNWTEPLTRWRTWRDGDPMMPLPYTQPGSPAAHFASALGQYRNWARRDLLPNYGNALASVVVAPVIALVLSAILGAPLVLLCIVAIATPQLAAALCNGTGKPLPALRAAMDITLPLLFGFALFRPMTIEAAVAAIGYGIAFAGAVAPAWDTRAWNLGQAAVLLMLVVTRHPVGAFVVALLWLPQFLLQSQPSARRAQWWLIASMLVAAAAIG